MSLTPEDIGLSTQVLVTQLDGMDQRKAIVWACLMCASSDLVQLPATPAQLAGIVGAALDIHLRKLQSGAAIANEALTAPPEDGL